MNFGQFPQHVREAFEAFCRERDKDFQLQKQAAFEQGKQAGRDEVYAGLKGLSTLQSFLQPPSMHANTPVLAPAVAPVMLSQPAPPQADDGGEFDLDGLVEELAGENDPHVRQMILQLAWAAVVEAYKARGEDPSPVLAKLKAMADQGGVEAASSGDDAVWLAWTRAATRSGGAKAVGTDEHQGRTLYGKQAEAALRAQEGRGKREEARGKRDDLVAKIESGDLFSQDDWDGFQGHLQHLTTRELAELRGKLKEGLKDKIRRGFVKAGKNKQVRVENLDRGVRNLIQHAIEHPDLPIAASAESGHLSHLIAGFGGVRPDDEEFSKQFGMSPKEAVANGILPKGAVKAGGKPWSRVASALQAEGHVIVPDGEDESSAVAEAVMGGGRSAQYDAGGEEYEREQRRQFRDQLEAKWKKAEQPPEPAPEVADDGDGVSAADRAFVDSLPDVDPDAPDPWDVPSEEQPTISDGTAEEKPVAQMTADERQAELAKLMAEQQADDRAGSRPKKKAKVPAAKPQPAAQQPATETKPVDAEQSVPLGAQEEKRRRTVTDVSARIEAAAKQAGQEAEEKVKAGEQPFALDKKAKLPERDQRSIDTMATGVKRKQVREDAANRVRTEQYRQLEGDDKEAMSDIARGHMKRMFLAKSGGVTADDLHPDDAAKWGVKQSPHSAPETPPAPAESADQTPAEPAAGAATPDDETDEQFEARLRAEMAARRKDKSRRESLLKANAVDLEANEDYGDVKPPADAPAEDPREAKIKAMEANVAKGLGIDGRPLGDGEPPVEDAKAEARKLAAFNDYTTSLHGEIARRLKAGKRVTLTGPDGTPVRYGPDDAGNFRVKKKDGVSTFEVYDDDASQWQTVEPSQLAQYGDDLGVEVPDHTGPAYDRVAADAVGDETEMADTDFDPSGKPLTDEGRAEVGQAGQPKKARGRPKKISRAAGFTHADLPALVKLAVDRAINRHRGDGPPPVPQQLRDYLPVGDKRLDQWPELARSRAAELKAGKGGDGGVNTGMKPKVLTADEMAQWQPAGEFDTREEAEATGAQGVARSGGRWYAMNPRGETPTPPPTPAENPPRARRDDDNDPSEVQKRAMVAQERGRRAAGMTPTGSHKRAVNDIVDEMRANAGGGLVLISDVRDAVRARHPDITPEQFDSVILDMRRDRGGRNGVLSADDRSRFSTDQIMDGVHAVGEQFVYLEPK